MNGYNSLLVSKNFQKHKVYLNKILQSTNHYPSHKQQNSNNLLQFTGTVDYYIFINLEMQILESGALPELRSL